MTELSIVIPTYTLNQDLEQKAISAILSFSEDLAVKEIIVSEDGGFFSPGIMEHADTYMYNKKNLGFTGNVNRGWKMATGDYTAIVNSDIILRKGQLKDLCIPGKVTSPIIQGQYIEALAGSFFVVPKEVKEERGMLNEEMVNYCSDSDYDHRVRDIFKKVESVEVYHHIASTVTPAGINEIGHQTSDDAIYKRLIKEGRASG